MCSDWCSCNFGGMGNKRTFLNWQGNFFFLLASIECLSNSWELQRNINRVEWGQTHIWNNKLPLKGINRNGSFTQKCDRGSLYNRLPQHSVAFTSALLCLVPPFGWPSDPQLPRVFKTVQNFYKSVTPWLALSSNCFFSSLSSSHNIIISNSKHRW